MGRPRVEHKIRTNAGYAWHVRGKTLPCLPCLHAHAIYGQALRDKGRCAPGLGWPLEAPEGGSR